MFRRTLILSVLLASCTGRPQTAEYFTKVTGLPLCTGGSVRNLNADAPDRSPGFDSIYVVEVTVPAKCQAAFLKAVGQRIGAVCTLTERCAGNSRNGEFYSIEPLQGGFRVTHST